MVFGVRDTDDFARRRAGGVGRFVGREHNLQHDITDPNTGEAFVDIFDPSGVPSGNVIEIDDTSGNPEKNGIFRSSGKAKDALDSFKPASLDTIEDEIPLEEVVLQPDAQQGNRTGRTPDRGGPDITFGGRTGISSDGEKSSVSNNILSRFLSGQLTGIEAPSVSRGTDIGVGNALSVGNVSRNISILQNPFGMMQNPYPDAKMPRATEPTAQGAKSPSAVDTLKGLLAKNKSASKTTAQPSQTQQTTQRPVSSRGAIGQLSPIDVLRAMSKAKGKGKPTVKSPKPSVKTEAKTDVKAKQKPELKPVKLPDPKDLRGSIMVTPDSENVGKAGKLPIKIPLFTFGNTPEVLGGTPAYAKDDKTAFFEKNPELIAIEQQNIKKAIKQDPIQPIDYQGRINELKDPELDPLSPSYNFGKFFNNYILGMRLSRLSDKHNFEAGYPYDVRRSILRNPLTDPNIIVWNNGAAVQKLDPKLVAEFKRNIEETTMKPYALRDGIYIPNEEDELMKDDTKQVFDLMHLSENLLSHHYSDLDKHREYLESGKPMDSNFREMLSKVEGMLKKKLPAPALSHNPLDMNKKFKALKEGVMMPALDPKREVFEKFQKMLWSQNVGSKNNPEFNMLHERFSPKKDLAKVLLKTQPRTETAPFDVLSQELAETNHFMGSFMGKDDFGDRMLSDMLGRPTRESDLHESMGKSWTSGMLDQTSPLYNRGRKKKATQSSYNILTGEREFI